MPGNSTHFYELNAVERLPDNDAVGICFCRILNLWQCNFPQLDAEHPITLLCSGFHVDHKCDEMLSGTVS